MMSMLGQMAQITDNLFLCSAHAISSTRLKMHKITCIVNATLEVQSPKVPGLEVLRIRLEDVPHSDLGRYFDQVADKIHEVSKRGGNVLVHCVAGISRSSSLCIAYLIKYHRMTLKQAYQHVKQRRPIIRPNIGFFRQLVDYERKLTGKSTVKFISSGMGPVPDVYREETKNMVYVTTYGAAFGR